MNAGEVIAFVLYFLLVIGIGIFFFIKGKGDTGEKGFFLGGRKMNGLVSALSAGASDMSAWVLMGLPGAIYAAGLGQVWISIGLAIGTVLAWIFVAPKLRRYSILANDSITIPQYLTNRFKSKSKVLQIVCAVIFMIVYCVYGASSIAACGALFKTLFGLDERIAMTISTLIIIAYLFLGGYNAVCWTDFFQGMIMLIALMLTPIVAAAVLQVPTTVDILPANFYNMFTPGDNGWSSAATILTGLGWGLGYFGMPHIIVRYISIKSEKEMKKSRLIGSAWTILILAMATVVALVGRKYLGAELLENGAKKLIFIELARRSFPFFIGGLIITAILAASMSTADSQLLASSSAFASDVYKTSIRKDASDKEILWVGRIVVIAVSLLAFMIAMLGTEGADGNPIVPAFSTIMGLVSAAWGAFGAAFGPVILLSLYNRRVNYKGATAGIIAGFVTDILWMIFFNMEYYEMTSVIYNTELYEIIPGFIVGLATMILVSYFTEKPSKAVVDLFDKVSNAEGVEVAEDGTPYLTDKKGNPIVDEEVIAEEITVISNGEDVIVEAEIVSEVKSDPNEE
ncbi:MAG: sodium/proline symporter [Clostridia bacterium]|nr:sodium/proline symporter [Clostridia bacterium]